MFTICKVAPDRIDIKLSGSIDSESMRLGLDDLIDKAEDVTHGRMLYEISGFAFPTMGALAVEMVRLPKLLGLLGKFDRCAVLSDSSWIRSAAVVEGALLPGFEIKGFTLEDMDKAEAWLAG